MPDHHIPISQLKPGMYVLAIFTGKKNLKVKSEGYILNTANINKLTEAGITRVLIDPKKEKQIEKIDKLLPEIPKVSSPAKPKPAKAKPAKSKRQQDIPLEQEISKAHQLYQNAKVLQKKILSEVKAGKALNIEALQQTSDAMVESIFRNQDALSCMSKLGSKSDYLIEHSLNTSILMTIFAKHLGIEIKIIQELALGAFLHDIGKIDIPDNILNKTSTVDEKEYEILKSHVSLGLKRLENSPGISHIAMTLIREHHERLDGSGYPQQLKNDEISKYGQMMGIIDSYDDMTAEQCYKTAIHPINAFKIFITESPSRYNEELVERFIQCLGVYPVGTLVKLNSGKLGLISKLNPNKPLHPFVKVFYNTRLNQAIAIEEIDLSKSKSSSSYKDQIDRCIKPEEFNINLLVFFKAAFMN